MTTPNQTATSVRLEPIREPEYEAWLAQSMVEYAEEKVQAGNYHPNEALQRAEQEYRELLPQGPATPGQHLFSIVDAITGDKVGVIWFAERPRGPRLEAFIFDLMVLEPFRRRGYRARPWSRSRTKYANSASIASACTFSDTTAEPGPCMTNWATR